MTEMTSLSSPTNGADKWTIYVDGASNATGIAAGIILKNENGILIEVSLALSFPTSNNQAEYETFLAGLRLA
ncbi:putative gag polyprotein, partial [Trifolium medium]|nr:putative gag polyprotein [Trifolium medium]